MTMSDPIADMLTRIRNANTAKHDTVDVPSSSLMVISDGRVLSNVPFGPFTTTWLFSWMSTVTPAGIATGSLPIRDIPISSY